MSRPTSSGSSRLIVGGTMRCCSASTVATDSRAPAAPSRCPVIDLVEVTTTPSTASPSACRMAPASATSPCGVEVAWALMCTMSEASSPPSTQRDPHRPGGAETRGVRLGDVVGVGGDAGAGDLGVHLGAAGLRVLLGLQDQHRGALAEDEAVAALVPRAGGTLGLVVALGERHHLAEGGHRQRVHGRLGAADDDDVGTAEADHVDAEGDRTRCRRRRPRRGCAPRPWRRSPGRRRRRDRSASASGSPAERPGAGPSP